MTVNSPHRLAAPAPSGAKPRSSAGRGGGQTYHFAGRPPTWWSSSQRGGALCATVRHGGAKHSQVTEQWSDCDLTPSRLTADLL